MKIRNLLLGTVMAFGFTSVANAGLITIDDFSTDQGPISATVGNTIFDAVEGLGILGGERDLMLTNFASNSASSAATVQVDGGMFHLSSAPGVEAQFEFQWDGVDGSENINTYGLGGVDFTEVGSFISFVTNVAYSDFGSWFDVTFWSNGGDTVETVALPTPGIDWPGRDAFFTSREFSLTNFADIGAIRVRGNIVAPGGEFEGSRVPSYDLQLNSVTAVPEPTPIALLAAGLLGVAWAGRRNRKAAQA